MPLIFVAKMRLSVAKCIVKGSAPVLEPPGAPRRAGRIFAKTRKKAVPEKIPTFCIGIALLETSRATRKAAGVSLRSPADPAPFPEEFRKKLQAGRTVGRA